MEACETAFDHGVILLSGEEEPFLIMQMYFWI